MPPYTRTVTLERVKRLESLRARLQAVDPFRKDVALAAALVVATAVELSLIDSQGHDRAITIAAAVLAVSSLALRRREPLAAAVIFVVPTLAQALLDGFMTSYSTTPFIAVMLLLYSIGRYADERRFVPAAAVLSVGMTIALVVEAGLEFGELFWVIFLFGLPILAGRALRSRALLQAELRDKTERAERARAARARGAVEEERGRIAAELQTLVANGLSAMVVQAETVPRALNLEGPAKAADALAAIEETGRDALTEMRRLLGVLRRDDDGAELAPQPGLGRVESLVERVRERGLHVELTVEGAERPLPAGVDLTAYRVVEDALEAAGERGANSASVLLRYLPGQLQLQVTDDRAGGASDRLPGLRDRVGLYGGHLRAERLDEDGFRLRATLPIEESR